MVNVTWDDAVAFCKWLRTGESISVGLSPFAPRKPRSFAERKATLISAPVLSRREGKTYRLPAEAEWEYACRAGTKTRYYSGDDPEMLAKVGNVADAAAKAKFPDLKYTIKANDGYAFTAPVGKFKPNAFGLYDMHGNAYQWCADWYAADYYGKSPVDDPKGPDTGDFRVVRSGCFSSGPISARSAGRMGFNPRYRHFGAGFRVAMTLGVVVQRLDTTEGTHWKSSITTLGRFTK